jgi:hypothetical protein
MRKTPKSLRLINKDSAVKITSYNHENNLFLYKTLPVSTLKGNHRVLIYEKYVTFYKGSYAVIFIIKGNYSDYIVFII